MNPVPESREDIELLLLFSQMVETEHTLMLILVEDLDE